MIALHLPVAQNKSGALLLLVCMLRLTCEGAALQLVEVLRMFCLFLESSLDGEHEAVSHRVGRLLGRWSCKLTLLCTTAQACSLFAVL